MGEGGKRILGRGRKKRWGWGGGGGRERTEKGQ